MASAGLLLVLWDVLVLLLVSTVVQKKEREMRRKDEMTYDSFDVV